MLSIVWNIWDHETYPTGWLGVVHVGRRPFSRCRLVSHFKRGQRGNRKRVCFQKLFLFCVFKKSLIKDNNDNNKQWITDALTSYKKTGAKRHVSTFHCGHAAGHRGFPINLRLWRYTEVVDVKLTGQTAVRDPFQKRLSNSCHFLAPHAVFYHRSLGVFYFWNHKFANETTARFRGIQSV